MKYEQDEHRLAQKARAGDREALAALIRHARPRLFAIAYAELRHHEDAQDVVAAALVRICRHISRLQTPESVRMWMNSIVRHEARRLHSRRVESIPEALLHEPALPDSTALFLLRLDLERALARLPGPLAQTLRLFYFASRPISDIATQLELSEGTIKSRLSRGRRQLARMLEDYRPMDRYNDPLPEIDSAEETPRVRSFAAKAKWASNQTLALCVQQGREEIEPDDLALVLLKDADLASYHAMRSLGIDIEALRQELLHRLDIPTLTSLPPPDFLETAQQARPTDRFNRMMEHTYHEAGRSHARRLSTAHLLLGILDVGESRTGQLLAERGITAEALRSAALPFHVEEESASEAYYRNEGDQFIPLWEQTWLRANEYVR